jgi:hypothetical protein
MDHVAANVDAKVPPARGGTERFRDFLPTARQRLQRAADAATSREAAGGVTDSHVKDSNASVAPLCSHEQIVPKIWGCLAHLKSGNFENMPKYASGPHFLEAGIRHTVYIAPRLGIRHMQFCTNHT